VGSRRTIDLNADVGEAADDAGVAVERGLLALVSSAHVACGGHAGDEATMRATVEAAMSAGIRVGAHPSYPDRQGFGRRSMEMERSELSSSLREQIAALVDVARACGTAVRSVKAHGALYADVALGGSEYVALAVAVAELCDPGTALVLPSGTAAAVLARDAGLPVLEEGFCDRAYGADGALVSRQVPGSVFDDPEVAAAQALGLARDGMVTAQGGEQLALHVDTLCLHGDSPNALAMARAVRAVLEQDGIEMAAAVVRHP
jgi:UPF0271 protein